MTQLALPFLEADDVATIDQARDAVDRAQGHALAARRLLEADELRRLGDRLVDMLERNACRVRADRPAHHPAPFGRDGGMADQVHSADTEHPERRT